MAREDIKQQFNFICLSHHHSSQEQLNINSIAHKILTLFPVYFIKQELNYIPRSKPAVKIIKAIKSLRLDFNDIIYINRIYFTCNSFLFSFKTIFVWNKIGNSPLSRFKLKIVERANIRNRQLTKTSNIRYTKIEIYNVFNKRRSSYKKQFKSNWDLFLFLKTKHNF